jgi:uncharacterized membrane protein
MNRYFTNLLTTRWLLRRLFPKPVIDTIEQAVRQSEQRHSGEIRFAIESSLDFPALWHGVTARDRAITAFSDLRTWDTEADNGVLIYLLLAEKDIEIVADRGYSATVPASEWQQICDRMRDEFHAGRFEQGALLGVELVTEVISRHFPPNDDDVNELPNRPVMI